MVLTGDIGGTHTRLGLFADPGSAAVAEHVFMNRDVGSFTAALQRFLGDAGNPRVSAAALAVAGPVLGGRVHMTNIAWTFDEGELARTLGGARVRLLNDLEAAAYGVLHLHADELRTLVVGVPEAHGNVAVIAAGTGLGKAILACAGDVPVAVASEGGHVDFAPRDPTDVALLEWLARSLPHVSAEHVCSGPGIVRIVEFLRDTGRAEMPEALRTRMAAAAEPAAIVTRTALAGEFPICEQALAVFVRAYGGEAGDLALTALAVGGVYVAGGIAPVVLQGRFAEAFVAAFMAKGRYAELLARVPVHVVLSDQAARVGARVVAERIAAL